MYEQSYTFSFEAAHDLSTSAPARNADDATPHEYSRLHGHSFVATVTLRTDKLHEGHWVADFADLKKACERLKAIVDHRLLNEVEGLEVPTLENIANWIFEELAKEHPEIARVDVERPTLGQRASYFST